MQKCDVVVAIMARKTNSSHNSLKPATPHLLLNHWDVNFCLLPSHSCVRADYF